MKTTKQVMPDRKEHAKAAPHPDERVLDERTEEEGIAVGIEPPGSDDEPTPG
jgi:hypothetical protein